MSCPVCGSKQFYVKDQDDEYESHDFELVKGQVVFEEGSLQDEALDGDTDTETFCNKCAWHGKLQEITP